MENNKPKIDTNWSADLPEECYPNIVIEDLKFIFTQAEKRLDDSIKNFDATTTKSMSFITLTTAILTTLTTYFLSKLDPQGCFSDKLFTVLSCCFYVGIILYRLLTIILPQKYQPVGTFPQDLLTQDFFKGDDQWNKTNIISSTYYIYLSELESYQRRIQLNDSVNTERLNQFNLSVKMMCGLPVFGVLIYVLSLFFSPLLLGSV